MSDCTCIVECSHCVEEDRNRLRAEVRELRKAARQIACTRCGILCLDYRQKGDERVCICCVEVERSALEARAADVEKAAEELAAAEAAYRRQYEMNGGSSIHTGRAWDRMRRAGDAVRAALPVSPTGGTSNA